MWPNLQIPVHLFKFAEKILIEKLHILCKDLINHNDWEIPTTSL